MTNVQSLFFYSCIFVSSILFSWLYERSYKRICLGNINRAGNQLKKYIFQFGVISFPVFASSIRYNVGTDYQNYRLHYYKWSGASLLEILKTTNEPLSYILHPLAKLLFGNEWGYFFLASMIIMFFITNSIFYYKDKISMPLAIFIYYMLFWSFSLNGIRQMMAISIIVYAYRYIIERKPYKYILYVFIASNFHMSALICIFFYLLNFRPSKLSIFRRIIYYLFLILLCFLMPLALQILLKANLFSKYSERYSINIEDGGVGFLIWILPAVIPILYYKKKLDNQYGCLFDICLMQIPLQYVGYYISFGYRIALYCLITQIILIPLIVESISNRREKLLVKMYFVTWYLFYFIIQSYLWNYSQACPFKSIL